jgi:hypothetical protein
MALRSLFLAAVLAVSAGPASAASQVVDLSSGGASFTFTAPILDGGDDVISFSNLATGTYNFIFSLEAQLIPDLTATLNGQAATITPAGNIRFAGLEGTSDAPFSLTLTGTPGVGARDTGSLQVQLVPEPATCALLLVGLGGIGFAARRRNTR